MAAFLITESIKSGDFREKQHKYPRVRAARRHSEISRDSLFRRAGLEYPPEEIFVRIFKLEEEVELWARNDRDSQFVLISTYPFTANSGTLGPKRAEGDHQIPEGFYYLDWFNPASNYLLSIRIDYPNMSDRLRASGDHPGGSIFIHGNQVTIGCVPIGNQAIEEFYIIAVDARDSGQKLIPTHIFPCVMDSPEGQRAMKRNLKANPGLKLFWDELRPGYEYFEESRRLPVVSIDTSGIYIVKRPGADD